MKRIFKILSFSAIALLLSLLLAVSISAEAGSIGDVKTGVSFDDGKITITYAVSGTDGSALKLSVYDSYPLADSEPLYETADYTDMTVGDTSYKVFSSDNILLQNLRKPYYARITSTNSDGKVLSAGAVIKLSVFDHYLNILSTGTEDQTALFTKLLKIGAAMQKQLLGSALYSNNDLTLAGGYSDEFYVLEKNICVDGEIFDTEYEYFSAPTTARIKADKMLGEASFSGFTDSLGARVSEYGDLTSSSWNEYPCALSSVGITKISVNYTKGGVSYIGYDESDAISKHGITNDSGTSYLEPTRMGVFTDKKGVASTTAVAGSAYVALGSKSTEKFLGFYKIIKALSDTTYKDTSADTSGAYKAGEIVNSATVKNSGTAIPSFGAAENADIHVFETDIYVYSPKNLTPTYVNLLNADGEAFWGFNIKTEGSGSTFSLTVRGGEDSGKCFTEGLTLHQREWYNLRIEYSFSDADEAEVKVYIDGKLAGAFSSPRDTAADGAKDAILDKVLLYHADGANNVTLCLDNTLITSLKAN